MKSPSVSLSWDEALTSQLRHQEAGASQHHMTAAYAPLKAHGISYKKATLSSTTTITLLLLLMLLFLFSSWGQIRSTPPPLRPGAGNTTTYIVIGYMKTWETFFFSRNRFRKLFNTGLSSPSCRGRPRLICGCQSRGYNYIVLHIYCLSLKWIWGGFVIDQQVIWPKNDIGTILLCVTM